MGLIRNELSVPEETTTMNDDIYGWPEADHRMRGCQVNVSVIMIIVVTLLLEVYISGKLN